MSATNTKEEVKIQIEVTLPRRRSLLFIMRTERRKQDSSRTGGKDPIEDVRGSLYAGTGKGDLRYPRIAA
jgi:hypothetical protein